MLNPRTTSPRPKRSRRWGPGLPLFAAALLARLACAWITLHTPLESRDPDAPWPPGRGASENRVARNLAWGIGFSDYQHVMHPPTARVAPVTPWLASLGYRTFAKEPLTSHEMSTRPRYVYERIVYAQCVLGALVPLLLLVWATALWGSSVGVMAAWIAAMDPILILAAPRLSSDVVLGTTLLAALAATAAWIKTPRRGRALGVGLLWGIAILTRPSLALLPFMVAAWGWIPLGLAISPAGRRTQIALVLAGMLCVAIPWSVRSSVVARGPVLIATGSGTEWLAGNNADAWEESTPGPRGGRRDFSTWSDSLTDRGVGEAAVDRRAAARAWEFLSGRLAEWPAQAVHKVVYAWSRLPPAGPGSDGAGLIRPVDPRLAWTLPLVLAALWGTGRLRSNPRRWFQLLPVLVILYDLGITVIYSGPSSSRIAVEPLVVLLAAVGWDDARRRVQARARGFRVIEGQG